MVSKHRESTYRGGRFRHWIKIKKPAPSSVQPGAGSVLINSMMTNWPAIFAVTGGACDRWLMVTPCDRPHGALDRRELRTIDLTQLPCVAAPPLSMPTNRRAPEAAAMAPG